MKKIIITGSNGLLGQFLCQYFSNKYQITGTHLNEKPSSALYRSEAVDLTNLDKIQSVFNRVSPDIVINTAGLTTVDGCEENPELAFKLNSEIPANIVQCLAKTTTQFIQISTDHLYDGTTQLATEDLTEQPLNIYAHSKLQGDCAALKYNHSTIVRTNFYGGVTQKKLSFANWIYKKLSTNQQIPGLIDVYFSPISVCGLADNLDKLIDSSLTGKFNIAGEERLSKYDFALKIADHFHFSRDLIVPKKLSDIHLKAPRPMDMSLSNKRATQYLTGFTSENIEQGLIKLKSWNLI